MLRTPLTALQSHFTCYNKHINYHVAPIWHARDRSAPAGRRFIVTKPIGAKTKELLKKKQQESKKLLDKWAVDGRLASPEEDEIEENALEENGKVEIPMKRKKKPKKSEVEKAENQEDVVDADYIALSEGNPPLPVFDYTSMYRNYSETLSEDEIKELRRMERQEDWGRTFPWEDHVNELNQKLFGNSGFRPLQLEALNALLAGENVLALLPSGGGKSLLYQLFSLIGPGVVVVVSPLLALIQDQMLTLRRLGIPARAVSSRKKQNDILETYSEMCEERVPFKVLFVTPERIFRTSLRTMHRHGQLRLFVVDEAHCISEWGHDFRPDYRKLQLLSRSYPGVPILALTGSCTPEVRNDIREQLLLDDCQVFSQSAERENIKLEVRDRLQDDVADDIGEFIAAESLTEQCGLVYCVTRKEAERVAADLEAVHGLSVAAYHAKMSPEKLVALQKQWMDGNVRILCTTVAFGLGIDKADVRFVLHACMPTSLETYYQQVGRAGRDGLPAKTALFFSVKDHSRVQMILQNRAGDEEGADDELCRRDVIVRLTRILTLIFIAQERKMEKLDDLVQYCVHEGCRRKFLLGYFGEKFECSFDKDNCDMCSIMKARAAAEERDRRLGKKRKSSAQNRAEPGEQWIARREAEAIEPLKPAATFMKPKATGVVVNALLDKDELSDEEETEQVAEASVPRKAPPSISLRSTKTPLSSPLAAALGGNAQKSPEQRGAFLRARPDDALMKKINAALERRPGLLSKNSIRALVKAKPQSFMELAAIKGIGRERASLVKNFVLPLFQEEEDEMVEDETTFARATSRRSKAEED